MIRQRVINIGRKKSTEEIIESLQPGQEQPLTVDKYGKVWQCNTRTLVLEERGVDINQLPRVPK